MLSAYHSQECCRQLWGNQQKKKKNRFSRELFSKKQGIYDRIILFQNIFGTIRHKKYGINETLQQSMVAHGSN
jgi:hypothetical protein